MAIVLVALIGLISCTTVKADINKVEESYKDTVISLYKNPPTLPSFPQLSWVYQDGMYCISESDADKLISYVENDLASFKSDYEVYVYTVEQILESIKN